MMFKVSICFFFYDVNTQYLLSLVSKPISYSFTYVNNNNCEYNHSNTSVFNKKINFNIILDVFNG